MNIFQEAKERAHAEGKVIHLNETHEIPDEYRQFIGKLSDGTLYFMSYEYDKSVGGMVGPNVTIPSDVVEQLGEFFKWSIATSRLIKIVLDDGLENIRKSKASEYMAREGFGKKIVDALVEIGLPDDRDEVNVTKPKSVDCYIEGVLYEDVEKFDFNIETLEISRSVERALGGKNIKGRFVGKIHAIEREP